MTSGDQRVRSDPAGSIGLREVLDFLVTSRSGYWRFLSGERA